MKRTDFSKYFHDEINDGNWDVAVDKDGFFCIVDGDGTCVAENIDHWDDAVAMALGQRLFNLSESHLRENLLAIATRERDRINTKEKQA